MTPQQFIARWQNVTLTERSACQSHFLDLCELLGQPKPVEADPEGAWYTFERGVRKSDGGDGWADVWMRNHFGWEYKGKKKDLNAAYQQLLKYREDLDNPPLLVVCDLDRFEVHTNFTGTAKKIYAFDLASLAEPENLDVLRKLFTEPEALRPGQTTASITEQAAERLGQLADGMRVRGIAAPDAAHFLMKLMFCMFAEDIRLLPANLFSRLLTNAKNDPARLTKMLRELFEAMASGGMFGSDDVLYFNGGLFADAEVIELTPDEIRILLEVMPFDWSAVEPSIFGTLFERTLDPTKRAQIGAHYTSREDIETLLRPVMLAPLRRRWDETQTTAEALWTKVQAEARERDTRGGRGTKKDTPSRRKFDKLIRDFVAELDQVTVLDPACGSGNFLYVALHLLLDLEKEVITYASNRGLPLIPQVRPTQLHGIEINPYAQQLAQVVIWIGYLQWMHDNGFNPPSNPVLEPIESIENRDAIFDLTDPEHPQEPEWPAANFIVGNPPFLGDKLMRGGLGDEYVTKLRKLYERLPGQSDLCCYWFEKARQKIVDGTVGRAGLLATQGIRGGSNRDTLMRIKDSCQIFFAVSDREWILDGAMVHVSMVGFDNGSETGRPILDGKEVDGIESNLSTGAAGALTSAKPLISNSERCFLGVMKAGAFNISDANALDWILQPNPTPRRNSDVLRPRRTARDILNRADWGWIIDFGCETPIETASHYEVPWQHVEENVFPKRRSNRRKALREYWWIHGEPRPGLRMALAGLRRFIVTPEVSKHRIFIWLDDVFLADHQTRAFAFDGDYEFGLLHSIIHERWARAMGTQLRERESGFRYTPTTCFGTFPFPEPTDEQRRAIAAAAKELNDLRERWLNPPEWTRTETLEFSGSANGPWGRFIHDPTADSIGTVRYPRLVAIDAECANHLKNRTLTKLYNQRPAWLDLAHKKLDEAVFAAYGWDPTISGDDLLAKLLSLNLARPHSGPTAVDAEERDEESEVETEEEVGEEKPKKRAAKKKPATGAAAKTPRQKRAKRTD